ncbi:MAG: DODA-type extradiol aromatic ring-opening family dioxygenase [Candidatus Geothermincolia bacterium]
MSGAGILAACVTPHPPLLIPGIGGAERRRVAATDAAMRRLASELAALSPEVLVMISPHSDWHPQRFIVRVSRRLAGDFGRFGSRSGSVKENDVELAEEILREAGRAGLDCVPEPPPSRAGWKSETGVLDHGLLVPLHYLDEAFESRVVSLSISLLGAAAHFKLGEAVAAACEARGRRAVFVASGDLSHRLLPGAPAGFDASGEEFDGIVTDIAARGGLDEFLAIDESLSDAAGECGLRSLQTMAGALANKRAEHRVLSYEGPFGVGYMVSLHLVAEA